MKRPEVGRSSGVRSKFRCSVPRVRAVPMERNRERSGWSFISIRVCCRLRSEDQDEVQRNSKTDLDRGMEREYVIINALNRTTTQLAFTCTTVPYNHPRARVHHDDGGESRGINYAAPALWKTRSAPAGAGDQSIEQVNPVIDRRIIDLSLVERSLNRPTLSTNG